MGYNGFGLQKWIYKQKPRRPFSKDRKPTGDKISQASSEFILHKNKTELGDRFKIVFALLFILLSAVLIYYGLGKATSYSKKVNLEIDKTEQRKEDKAFTFLFESAKEFSIDSNYKRAKTDFELALKIKSENRDANKYYAQALLALCKKEKTNCNLCLETINNTIINYPNDFELEQPPINRTLFQK